MAAAVGEATRRKVKRVVVDAGAFIQNAPIRDIGEKIYTVQSVISEIRNKDTRQRLQVLPYDIEFKTPTPEAIKAVTDFSKQTGDYKSLSATDLKLLALTYQLEKQYVGIDHIRTVPDKKVVWTTSKEMLEKPVEIVGFYLNKCEKGNTSKTPSAPTKEDETSELESKITDICIENCESGSPRTESEEGTELHESVECDQYRMEDSDVLTECIAEIEEDENDDSNDEGWITPTNVRTMIEKLGTTNTVNADVDVGCLTTDFAMQNVLIQMGLNVISVGGMLIKQAKNYVFRCLACLKITTDVTRNFCPHCGNMALHKMSMTVQEDGTVQYFFSTKKPLKTKRLKFSLPLPRGGKHAQNPILVEDQPLPQQRESKKAREKMNVFDIDYVARYSPFMYNDITSRAGLLGIYGPQNNKRNKQRHCRRK